MQSQSTDIIKTLLRRLREGGTSRSNAINPFWTSQLAAFHELLQTTEAPTHQQLRSALGYNDKHLPKGVQSNRELPSWSELKRLVEQRVVDLPERVAEHVGSLSTLRMHTLLDRYLHTIDEMRIRSSMTIARHFWYSCRLQYHLNLQRLAIPGIFLEIGAGGGQLFCLMARGGYVKKYVIVDLPAMLINSVMNISDRFPEASLYLNEVPETAKDDLIVCFVEADCRHRIPHHFFDVALNFNSLMEMDREVRDGCIALVHACLKDGGLFYNVNRRQTQMTMRDGSVYDNNPLLYPYAVGDAIIEWEPDEFQQNYRSRSYRSPHKSFAISRVSIARK